MEKLISACSPAQVSLLLARLAPQFNLVACQKHGSFACQALVDALSTDEQVEALVRAVELPAAAPDGGASPLLRDLCVSASGHFVVLRMLARLPPNALSLLDRCMEENALSIGCDHHGLRVIKVATRTSMRRLSRRMDRPSASPASAHPLTRSPAHRCASLLRCAASVSGVPELRPSR